MIFGCLKPFISIWMSITSSATCTSALGWPCWGGAEHGAALVKDKWLHKVSLSAIHFFSFQKSASSPLLQSTNPRQKADYAPASAAAPARPHPGHIPAPLLPAPCPPLALSHGHWHQQHRLSPACPSPPHSSPRALGWQLMLLLSCPSTAALLAPPAPSLAFPKTR